MRLRRGVVLSIVALAVTACSSGSGSTSRTSDGQSPQTALPVATTPQALRAVTITSCAANAKRNVQISGTVHNSTARQAGYVIELSIRSRAGTALFATAAAARAVAPQSTARWTAATTARFQPGMTCTVTGVSQR